MPAVAPTRALCLHCASIREALDFPKVLSMNTAGMISIRYREKHVTKNNDGKVTKTELLWNTKLKEGDKLQPINFGAGPCLSCRESAVKIDGKLFLPIGSVEKAMDADTLSDPSSKDEKVKTAKL